MSDENRVLDLDQLLGQARAVKVRWQGREYELLRMDGISPKQSLAFQRMIGRVQKLQSGEAADDDQQASELEALMKESLRLLCKDLPVDDIPFAMQMKILMFYTEEMQGKKALEVALSNLTGATSSPV